MICIISLSSNLSFSACFGLCFLVEGFPQLPVVQMLWHDLLTIRSPVGHLGRLFRGILDTPPRPQ